MLPSATVTPRVNRGVEVGDLVMSNIHESLMTTYLLRFGRTVSKSGRWGGRGDNASTPISTPGVPPPRTTPSVSPKLRFVSELKPDRRDDVCRGETRSQRFGPVTPLPGRRNATRETPVLPRRQSRLLDFDPPPPLWRSLDGPNGSTPTAPRRSYFVNRSRSVCRPVSVCVLT